MPRRASSTSLERISRRSREIEQVKPGVAVTLCGHAEERCEHARARYLAALARAGAEPLPVDPGDELPDLFDALVRAAASTRALR